MLWTFYYGLLSAFAPTYGWILVLRSLVFWALGAVLAVVLAMLVMPWLGWRWLLGLSTLPFLLYLAFCYWLPESVHYDLLAGNPDAAMATLARLAADNGKPPPTETLTAGPFRWNAAGSETSSLLRT
ncbi:hypothetical protein CRUP_029299 [Coryphaenoides rupestris]|nr:hypothetical protein CRUP_029299 [Coryphaenoides rupestris]